MCANADSLDNAAQLTVIAYGLKSDGSSRELFRSQSLNTSVNLLGFIDINWTYTVPAGGIALLVGEIIHYEVWCTYTSGQLLGAAGTSYIGSTGPTGQTATDSRIQEGEIVYVGTQSSTSVGAGVSSRAAIPLALARSSSGKGVSSFTRAVAAAKTFSLVGAGVPTFTRLTTAARTFSLTGKGTATRVLTVNRFFNLIGSGVTTFTRAVTAAKTFSLVGAGVVTQARALVMSRSLTGAGVLTFVKALIASRVFSLQGKGEIVITGSNASSITIPIDEVPTGGAPAAAQHSSVF